jgi:putative ABC transport system substrate-binding protein
MKRKIPTFALGTILVALYISAAQAHQTRTMPLIGYLARSGSGPSPAFILGLSDLGYVEGKNIGVVFRTAEGRQERYAVLAAELVRLKVDMVLADNTLAALALKKATSQIPIVITNSSDPVGTGLVASFARPGGNVTGLTNVGTELGGKLLELLKETVPRLSRAAILRGPGPSNDLFVKEMEGPARALKIQLISVKVGGPEDIEDAFRTITKEGANGLLVRLLGFANLKRVADLAIKNRLPTIGTPTNWVESGGLMSYGADLNVQYRRAASYAVKILKGTKPGDLPIEAPMKFEMKINLQTAKQLGLTIPPNTLARADRVIK